MKKKHASILSLIFMALIGVYFFSESVSIIDATKKDPIGPGYLPFWLSVILFILCAISFVKTLMEKSDENETIDFPNMKLLGLTALILVLFCLSWSTIGYFYLQCVVFLTVLMTI